ncbi:MAG: MaoC family dehydratase [Myxococcota bacterium]
MTPLRVANWDDLEEGHAFEPWERSDLSIELFRAYGEASGDGNPMHTDEEYARDLGHPTVFAQGMLIMAFAAKYVTDIAGVGNVRRLWARFAQKTWPGESLRFTATLGRKYREGDHALADLEIRGTGTDGEEKIRSEATVFCTPAAASPARADRRQEVKP